MMKKWMKRYEKNLRSGLAYLLILCLSIGGLFPGVAYAGPQWADLIPEEGARYEAATGAETRYGLGTGSELEDGPATGSELEDGLATGSEPGDDVLWEDSTHDIEIDYPATPAQLSSYESTYEYGVRNIGETDGILGARLELELNGVSVDDITVRVSINGRTPVTETMVSEEQNIVTYYLETEEILSTETVGYRVSIQGDQDLYGNINGTFHVRELKLAGNEDATSEEVFESEKGSEVLTQTSQKSQISDPLWDQAKADIRDCKTITFEKYHKKSYEEQAVATGTLSEDGYIHYYVDADGDCHITHRLSGVIVAQEDARSMFKDFACTQLSFDNLDTSVTTTIAGMFYRCKNLEYVDLSGFDPSSLKHVTQLFYGCESLKTAILTGLVTGKVSSLNYIFYACRSLRELDLSSWDVSGCEDFAFAFYGCPELRILDVSTWQTPNLRNLSYTFYWCDALLALDLSSWDVTKVSVWTSAFEDCYVNGPAYAKDQACLMYLNTDLFGSKKPSSWQFTLRGAA